MHTFSNRVQCVQYTKSILIWNWKKWLFGFNCIFKNETSRIRMYCFYPPSSNPNPTIPEPLRPANVQLWNVHPYWRKREIKQNIVFSVGPNLIYKKRRPTGYKSTYCYVLAFWIFSIRSLACRMLCIWDRARFSRIFLFSYGSTVWMNGKNIWHVWFGTVVYILFKLVSLHDVKQIL